MESKATTVVDQIPDPRVVRARLAEVLRESSLLRRLLRVSEQAAKHRHFNSEAVQQ
jgi:hypothetical protein